MARLKGLEPLAHCLEGSCSIHLSYRRVSKEKAGQENEFKRTLHPNGAPTKPSLTLPGKIGRIEAGGDLAEGGMERNFLTGAPESRSSGFVGKGGRNGAGGVLAEGGDGTKRNFFRRRGAGDGNRTHATSLEGWDSTIELHPQEDIPANVSFGMIPQTPLLVNPSPQKSRKKAPGGGRRPGPVLTAAGWAGRWGPPQPWGGTPWP